MELDIKNRLIEVMSQQSSSYKTKKMVKFIKSKLKDIPGVSYYVKDGNLYATKGVIGKDEKYPCVVSHTDTVHRIVDSFKVFEDDGWLFAMDSKLIVQAGIGGDDKVGIFICLEMMRMLDTCKVAFFRDEEVGCVGSAAADMKFFDDVGYVFECDRKGNKDFVTNISGELSSKEFQDSIEDLIGTYGYSFTDGGLTDVDQLKDNGLDVCVANMSCGYYSPHTSEEVICIEDVFNTMLMVADLINHLGNVEHYHHRETYTYGGWDDYDYYYGRPNSLSNYYGQGLNKNTIKKSSSWVGVVKDLEKEVDTRCPECQHELEGEHGAMWCENSTCLSNELMVVSNKVCDQCGDYEHVTADGFEHYCLSCYWAKVELMTKQIF